jgi:hypothetical protein
MKRSRKTVVGVVFCVLVLLTTLSMAMCADVPRMTKEELKALLEKGDMILLDVRSGRDWKSSEFIIPKAVRVEPSKLASWASKYSKDKTLVLY